MSSLDTHPGAPAVAEPSSSLVAWLGGMTRSRAVLLSLTLILAIAVADLSTALVLTFTLLYVFPIAFATWTNGRRTGTACAVLAGGAVAIDSAVNAGGMHLLASLWNDAGALGIFLLSVAAIDRLRVHFDQERRARTVAIIQLRHAERLNLIGKLAAGVAHELGTPLNVITGSAELLADSPLSAPAVQEFTGTILEQADRMAGIIRHLLEFGRRGGTQREAKRVDALVERTGTLLFAIVRRWGCSLEMNLDAGDAVAVMNPSEIQQVVSNLVINAAQAMQATGGVVRIETSLVRRESRTRAVRLSVVDSGIGIDDADLPHIFDPFFTTKGVGQGTGLGLSVSYGIVADHGGRIEVSSKRGEGTRFSVFLDLASSDHLER